MHRLTLAQSNAIIAAAMAHGEGAGMKPLTVSVLDPGGNLIACARADGASNIRVKLASGKAAGALALGVSSRTIGTMAEERPHFIAAVDQMGEGGLVPAAGGVIVVDAARVKGNYRVVKATWTGDRAGEAWQIEIEAERY